MHQGWKRASKQAPKRIKKGIVLEEKEGEEKIGADKSTELNDTERQSCQPTPCIRVRDKREQKSFTRNHSIVVAQMWRSNRAERKK